MNRLRAIVRARGEQLASDLSIYEEGANEDDFVCVSILVRMPNQVIVTTSEDCWQVVNDDLIALGVKLTREELGGSDEDTDDLEKYLTTCPEALPQGLPSSLRHFNRLIAQGLPELKPLLKPKVQLDLLNMAMTVMLQETSSPATREDVENLLGQAASAVGLSVKQTVEETTKAGEALRATLSGQLPMVKDWPIEDLTGCLVSAHRTPSAKQFKQLLRMAAPRAAALTGEDLVMLYQAAKQHYEELHRVLRSQAQKPGGRKDNKAMGRLLEAVRKAVPKIRGINYLSLRGMAEAVEDMSDPFTDEDIKTFWQIVNEVSPTIAYGLSDADRRKVCETIRQHLKAN